MTGLAERLNTTPEYLGTRLAWLLYRQWAWRVQRWYRQRTCGEHEPMSVQVGQLQEFIDGGNGHQRVVCGRCGVTLRDFPA